MLDAILQDLANAENMFFNKKKFDIINDFGELQTFSASLYQNSLPKLFKFWKNSDQQKIPRYLQRNKKLDSLIEELVNDLNFEKSVIEIEKKSIEELKNPEEYEFSSDYSILVVLNDPNEKEKKSPEIKLSLNLLGTLVNLFLRSHNIITNYQNELLVPIEEYLSYIQTKNFQICSKFTSRQSKYGYDT